MGPKTRAARSASRLAKVENIPPQKEPTNKKSKKVQPVKKGSKQKQVPLKK